MSQTEDQPPRPSAAPERLTKHLPRLIARALSGLTLFVLAWTWLAAGRWLWRPSLVFMVYPGSRRYQDRFILRSWLRWMPFPDIVPIGLVRVSGRWGVYASATHILTEEPPQVVGRITRSIMRTFPYARSVSLAGGWPSTLAKAGLPTHGGPIVNGTRGTVYAMERVCDAMVRRCGVPASEAHLCVLGGGGFVGRKLLPRLAKRYARVTAIDPCYEREERDGHVCRTPSPELLASADAVLVLTPRGDDALAYARHAAPGQIWGDDTFPDMSLATQAAFCRRGVRLFKTSLADTTLRFLPKLPTFGRSKVPGCLVAALVNEVEPDVESTNRFYRLADRSGVEARLFEHP